MKQKAKTRRIILASFVGALFALLAFIDVHSFLITLGIKAGSTLAITAIAFAFHSFKELCKYSLLTLCISFVYSGMMIAVYRVFRPPNMLIVNDIVYFRIDPLVLIALTGVIYGFVTLTERILRERIKGSVARLEFTVGEHSYTCMAKIDTGCSLTEPFSGSPVIVADSDVLTIPDGTERRVIPYATVGASSLLFAVRAGAIHINGKPIDKVVYIAEGSVRSTAYQAIINSDIIR